MLFQSIEIHQHVVADLFRQQWHGRTARNDRLEIVPAAAHAAAMGLDQGLERDAHHLFDITRRVHMARDREHLGAGVALATKACKPFCAAAQNGRGDGDGFHVVHGGRRAIQARIRRERRLQTRLALLAFEAFEQRGFLAADIRAGAVVDIEIEIPAMDIVLADQLGVIRLLDGGFHPAQLELVFTADIDVASVRLHGERRDQAALDQGLGIIAHDLPVLTGARFGFVCVHDQIVRASPHFLGHERPFQTGREARAAAAAQTGLLHLVDDPVPALIQNVLGGVPVTALLRAFKAPVMAAIEVGEDPVLILQ